MRRFYCNFIKSFANFNIFYLPYFNTYMILCLRIDYLFITKIAIYIVSTIVNRLQIIDILFCIIKIIIYCPAIDICSHSDICWSPRSALNFKGVHTAIVKFLERLKIAKVFCA